MLLVNMADASNDKQGDKSIPEGVRCYINEALRELQRVLGLRFKELEAKRGSLETFLTEAEKGARPLIEELARKIGKAEAEKAVGEVITNAVEDGKRQVGEIITGAVNDGKRQVSEAVRNEGEKTFAAIRKSRYIAIGALAIASLIAAGGALLTAYNAKSSVGRRAGKIQEEVVLAKRGIAFERDERHKLETKLEINLANYEKAKAKEITELVAKIRGEMCAEVETAKKGLEVLIATKPDASKVQADLKPLLEGQEKIRAYFESVFKKYDAGMKRLEEEIGKSAKREDYDSLRKVIEQTRKEIAGLSDKADGLLETDKNIKADYAQLYKTLSDFEKKQRTILEIMTKMQKAYGQQ